MAIQMRRGLRADFDPYKMLPGEWAVSIDASTSNQIVWMCFEPGVCKRMGTYEDFVEQVKEATADIKTEYVEEFDKILDEIKALSSQVSDGKDAVVSIKTTIEDEYLPQIQGALSEIQEKVSEAKNSADAAAVSAVNAKNSEVNAKKSEVNAKNSETEAKTSETNAATSESNAKTSETNAATSATTATAKATDAANYASNAETSALTATNKAIEASQYAEEAAESAKQSQISADAAAVSETNAKTSEANAKTYAEQAKEVSAVEVMTEENNGIGKPDGDTITVDENGTFKAIKAEQDGNGKVISDTYATKSSILNSQEEIEANTSEGNIAGALAVKEISKKMQNQMETSSDWEDITRLCDFGFVNTIDGKVYKNSALRMVSFWIAVDSDVNNQGTIFVVGTLPDGCNPKILISSCGHTTDGVSVNLLTDGSAVKSSHSTDIPIANARFSGLIAY